jgi:hypothetical protein
VLDLADARARVCEQGEYDTHCDMLATKLRARPVVRRGEGFRLPREGLRAEHRKR